MSIQPGFTFAQVCDPQLGMGGYEHDMATFAQAITQINELKPDFALICGDLVDRPDPASYRDIQNLMSRFQVPYYCVPGNHDLLHPPYDEEVGQNEKGSLQNYRSAFGDDYYTFDHQGYRFICINTQLWSHQVSGETEKQKQWLVRTLEQSFTQGTPSIMVGHHPLYLESIDEPDQYFNLPKVQRLELLSLFEKHGVLAMLSGHTHRIVSNTHRGMQLVSGEATSVNFRSTPLGFRLWRIEGQPPFHHQSIQLKLDALPKGPAS